MARVKTLAVSLALALACAGNAALAKPLPIASQDEADAFAERTVAQRCIWADGHLLCGPYLYEHAELPGDQYNSGYYAPGIYVGDRNPNSAAPIDTAPGER